jgi:hypothetical protein
MLGKMNEIAICDNKGAYINEFRGQHYAFPEARTKAQRFANTTKCVVYLWDAATSWQPGATPLMAIAPVHIAVKDWVKVFVNQGYRDGRVLARIENQHGNFVLVEYEMPNGTTALREYSTTSFDAKKTTRADILSTSYRTLDVEWLQAICGEGGAQFWTGTPQGKNGKYTRMPTPQEMLETKLAKRKPGMKAQARQ